MPVHTTVLSSTYRARQSELVAASKWKGRVLPCVGWFTP